MPSISTINPISPYNYETYGGRTGIGDALTGASGLAQAIAGNPAAQAQASYLGAETAKTQAGTQGLLKDQGDRDTIKSILANPNAGPADFQQVGAIMASNPNTAAQLPQVMNSFVQYGIMLGKQGMPTQAAADTFAGGSGVVAMGNTSTGQGRGLASEEKRTGMTAGAHVAAQRIASAASMRNEDVAQAGNDRRSTVPYKKTDGTIGYMTTAEAGRTNAPYYDTGVAQAEVREAGQDRRSPVAVVPPGSGPEVAPTLALPGDAIGKTPFQADVYKQAQTPQGVMQGGVPKIVPGYQTTQPGTSPIPTGTDQALGVIMSGAGQPAPAGGAGQPGAGLNMDNVMTGRPKSLAEAAATKTLGIPTQQPQPQAEGIKNQVDVQAAMLRELTLQLVDPGGQATMTSYGTDYRLSGNGDKATLLASPEARTAILDRYNAYLRGMVPGADQRLRGNPDDAMRQAVTDLKPQFDVSSGHGLNPWGENATVRLKQYGPRADGAAAPQGDRAPWGGQAPGQDAVPGRSPWGGYTETPGQPGAAPQGPQQPGVAKTLAGSGQAAATPAAGVVQAPPEAPPAPAAPAAARPAPQSLAAALAGSAGQDVPNPRSPVAAPRPPPAEATRPPGTAAVEPSPEAYRRAAAMPEKTIAEARAVIARNPAMAKMVVERLRAAGIPAPADVLSAAGVLVSAPTTE